MKSVDDLIKDYRDSLAEYRNKLEEYRRYLKKCEMLGTQMFKFEEVGIDIKIKRYIPNNEQYRVVKIPGFVDKIGEGAFKGIEQDLEVVYNGSKVTNFDYCFFRYKGEVLRLSSDNTSKIKDMQYMFYECSNLKELDLSNFDTRRVKNMNSMFTGCGNLERIDLSRFNTSKVTKMYRIFENCYSLKELDLSNFDMSSLDADGGYIMFNGCSNLRLIITNKVTKEWLIEHSDVIKLPKDVRVEVR